MIYYYADMYQLIYSTGLQIILKLQGPCGFLTYQDLLAHIDILGPKYLMKF